MKAHCEPMSQKCLSKEEGTENSSAPGVSMSIKFDFLQGFA